MPPTRARCVRRWCPAALRGFAWLALLGMLVGPFAPRTVEAKHAGGEHQVEFDTEIEDAVPTASARAIQRRARSLMPPSFSRAVIARQRVELGSRMRSRPWVRRWSVPRRVAPSDDPDENAA